MRVTNKLAGLVALCAATQGFAEDIESVTVTGTRLPETQLATHYSLARETIERVNPPTTVALLRQIPNLIISQNGAASGHSFASIRGGEPNFILVMVDGVAVNDPTNSSGGGFDYNQLDPALIERVEVYRGGTSAVHGGEAISGIIHFITRRTATSSVALEAGTDDQHRASLSLATSRQGDYAALLSLSANRERPSLYADHENRQALLKLTADKDQSQHQLLLSASHTDNQSLAEDSGGIRYANPRSTESRASRQWLASLLSQFQPASDQQWVARLSWSRHRQDTDNPGIAGGVLDGIPPSEIRSDYRKLDGELYFRWQPDTHWYMLAGASGQHAEGSNSGVLDFGFPVPVDFSLQQENYGLFAETSRTFGALTLELGARHDAPSGFDNELSSRFSLDYQFHPGARVYGAYSEGYKLPSFFALAHPLIGNPELSPELSKNSEIGLKLQGDNGREMALILFHNRYRDLVDFDPELFLSVNQSEVIASGVEWRGAGQLTPWLNLELDLTYLDTDIKHSDSRLRRRPRWHGGLHLHAALGRLDLSLSADSRGSFYDSSVPTGPVTLGGYTDVSLAARWQLGPAISLSLNVDNLLDKSYESAVGFIDPGAQIRAGVRYQL